MPIAPLKAAALSLLAALLPAPPGVLAQDVVDDDREARRLDQVQVTATRREETVLEIPVGVTVVDREQIERMAPQTVADLLHGEPGTYVQQTTPGQGVVIVRGLKGSEVLHLVDGFRLNNAFFRNAPNQYIALVDPLNLERIEVVRGPMSTLYGSDAMGGVVQFLTPDPRFAGSDWQSEGVVRARYGSADSSSHSRVALQGGREGLGIAAGVSYQDVGELRVGGGDELPFTAYSQRGGDFKLLLAPVDSGHELTVSWQYSKQPNTQRYDALVPGFGQTQPENAEFAFRPQSRRLGHLRYRYTEPVRWADAIELHLGEQVVVDDRVSRETGTPNREFEENSSTLRGFTGQFAKAAGDAHYLTWGWEYYQDTVDSVRERENIDTGAISARPSRYPDGSTMDSLAVYLADDWYLTERLDVNLGLRYSRFDIELPATANGIGVSLAPDDLSGHVGFAYKLGDSLRLVGNAGRGFRAPNIFDLGTFGDRPSNRFNIPNPDLEPESVNTVDFGLKYLDAAWQWEAMVFRSNYRDKITSVLTGEFTDTGRAIVQSQNATRLVLWGVESGLRYAPNEDWNLYATATYTRGDEEFEGDEYPADRIPPLFGKLGARWNFAERWDAEAYLLYATRQDRLSPRDAVDARINPDGSAGWITGNARLGWRASDALTVQLQLENIADKRYREHGSGLDQPGRNASLALDWRF
jgi:TonB-dependent heme/hemoglobin receptor